MTLQTATRLSHTHASVRSLLAKHGIEGGAEEDEPWREWSRRKIVEMQIKEVEKQKGAAAGPAGAAAVPAAGALFGAAAAAPAAPAAGATDSANP